MKKICRCYVCDKVIGFYKTYQAAYSGTEEIAPGIKQHVENVKVRICKACAAIAGYKVKEKKVKTIKEKPVENVAEVAKVKKKVAPVTAEESTLV